MKLFEEGRGTHFDPGLAGIFLENVDAFVRDQKRTCQDEADQPAAPQRPPAEH